MAYNEVYLIDELRTVAETTRAALGVQALTYIYAPIDEIEHEIMEMNKAGIQAEYIYPLMAVATDIEEQKGSETGIYSEIVVPQIIFAVQTNKDYPAKQRYERSIKQILQPIYSEFINQIHRSGVFRTQSRYRIPHKKTDRLSWGKFQVWSENKKSIDYIDAIEVNDLTLIIEKRNCSLKKN